jgi:hypothetical protein
MRGTHLPRVELLALGAALNDVHEGSHVDSEGLLASYTALDLGRPIAEFAEIKLCRGKGRDGVQPCRNRSIEVLICATDVLDVITA